jgi:hypothetical protein
MQVRLFGQPLEIGIVPTLGEEDQNSLQFFTSAYQKWNCPSVSVQVFRVRRHRLTV